MHRRTTVLSSLKTLKNATHCTHSKVIAVVPLLRVWWFFTGPLFLIILVFHSRALGNLAVTQSLPTHAREVSALLASSPTRCTLQLWKCSPLGIFYSNCCSKLCLSSAAKRFPLCPLQHIYLYGKGPPELVLSADSSLDSQTERVTHGAVRTFGNPLSKACWQTSGSPIRRTSDKFVSSASVDISTQMSNECWG